MKPLSKNNLSDKFWSGETSLDEDVLIQKQTDLNITEKAYFSFMSETNDIPENLENDIWNAIQKKRTFTKRIVYQWAIAASIAVLFGVGGIIKHQQQKTKLEQQFSLLEETLHHVSYELTNTHSSDVIYEDNFIVIVAEN